MKVIRPLVLVTLLLACPALWAQQAPRTFVSSTGYDGNLCTLTAPCRGIKRALAQTMPRGEVIALDSGVYDPFVVMKSVSIIAPPGIYAVVHAASGENAVQLGESTATVVLRGLTIAGHQVSNTGNPASNGVAGRAGALHLERCVITGFAQYAVTIVGKLFMDETVVRGNTYGVAVSNDIPGGVSAALIHRCRFEKNWTGLSADATGTTVTVSDSIFANNVRPDTLAYGVLVSNNAQVNVKDSIIAGNDNGVTVTNGGTATVSSCMITSNGIGLTADSTSTLNSFGDNQISGNRTPTLGSITIVPSQ